MTYALVMKLFHDLWQICGTLIIISKLIIKMIGGNAPFWDPKLLEVSQIPGKVCRGKIKENSGNLPRFYVIILNLTIFSKIDGNGSKTSSSVARILLNLYTTR